MTNPAKIGKGDMLLCLDWMADKLKDILRGPDWERIHAMQALIERSEDASIDSATPEGSVPQPRCVDCGKHLRRHTDTAHERVEHEGSFYYRWHIWWECPDCGIMDMDGTPPAKPAPAQDAKPTVSRGEVEKWWRDQGYMAVEFYGPKRMIGMIDLLKFLKDNFDIEVKDGEGE